MITHELALATARANLERARYKLGDGPTHGIEVEQRPTSGHVAFRWRNYGDAGRSGELLLRVHSGLAPLIAQTLVDTLRELRRNARRAA